MYYSHANCHTPMYYPVYDTCTCGSYQYGAVPTYPGFSYPPYPYIPFNNSVVVEIEEISADDTTNSSTGLVGGSSEEAHLTLEYMPNSAPATPASVKVIITTDGATSTWEETAILDGYHVKSDFIAVIPGSKITLEVNETTARLRWCETLCC